MPKAILVLALDVVFQIIYTNCKQWNGNKLVLLVHLEICYGSIFLPLVFPEWFDYKTYFEKATHVIKKMVWL